MGVRDDFRQALVDGDVRLVRRMWAAKMPHLPQPEDPESALICLHMARTSMNSIPWKLRAWSHRWLCERNLPSQLPEWLKPKAERTFPKIMEGVGFAWGCTVEALRGLTPLVEKAVTVRIKELLAEDAEPEFIRSEILRVKNDELKRLIGVFDPKETLK